MTPKRPAAAASALDSENALVIVCRGGDCGSRRKHPAVDHAAQLTTIRTRVGGAAEVLVSKCLDACEHSNVIVVVPGQEDRTRGAEPVWLGEVNDPDVTADLIDWVTSPTPWSVQPPTLVDIHTFTPPAAAATNWKIRTRCPQRALPVAAGRDRPDNWS